MRASSPPRSSLTMRRTILGVLCIHHGTRTGWGQACLTRQGMVTTPRRSSRPPAHEHISVLDFQSPRVHHRPRDLRPRYLRSHSRIITTITGKDMEDTVAGTHIQTITRMVRVRTRITRTAITILLVGMLKSRIPTTRTQMLKWICKWTSTRTQTRNAPRHLL